MEYFGEISPGRASTQAMMLFPPPTALGVAFEGRRDQMNAAHATYLQLGLAGNPKNIPTMLSRMLDS
eukprot:6207859-Pleurochrysis_carterae.AAC.1